MGKYRKKPILVEAFQEGKECPLWLTKAEMDGKIYYNEASGKLTIMTPEGHMQVSKGDWIIKGVMGEIYPCNPDVFEKTYVKVEEEDNDR